MKGGECSRTQDTSKREREKRKGEDVVFRLFPWLQLSRVNRMVLKLRRTYVSTSVIISVHVGRTAIRKSRIDRIE
jgi:hypothetical protein